MPRWPLFLIAAPAAVAVWSGWVGLGALAGFGLVEPLPGIVPWHLDTAITLPVGVEAYGAYALGAWLSPGRVSERARLFARRSAIGSLALGMAGQVAFHLLSAAHAERAPWPVTVLVACMPVCTLGLGVALTHLLRAGDGDGDMSGDRHGEPSSLAPQTAFPTGSQTGPNTGPGTPERTGSSGAAEPAGATPVVPVPESTAEPVRPKAPNRSGKRNANRNARRTTDRDAEEEFATEIAAGTVPTLYQIRTRLHVGNDRAKQLRQHIARQALTT